jgi:hypothetical protein
MAGIARPARWLVCGSVLALAACETRTPSASPSPVSPWLPPGAHCSVNLVLSPSEFDRTGGQALLRVYASAAACGWQLQGPDWVRFDDPGSGQGSAEVRLAVLPTTAGREGAIGAEPSPASVTIVQTPYSSVLRIGSVWCGPFNAGTYAPLACAVWVNTPADPPFSSGLRVTADLRAFGKSESWGVSRCPACGWPIQFDLDLHIPADMPAGTVAIPFTASDDQGRTAIATGNLTVVR